MVAECFCFIGGVLYNIIGIVIIEFTPSRYGQFTEDRVVPSIEVEMLDYQMRLYGVVLPLMRPVF
eukprot:7441857-Ditylum_brightwellii.AAC.1